MLWAGLLVDARTLEILSEIKLEESPPSTINILDLEVSALEFLASAGSTLTTPIQLERALQLYLEQRLTGSGMFHSEVIVKALVRR